MTLSSASGSKLVSVTRACALAPRPQAKTTQLVQLIHVCRADNRPMLRHVRLDRRVTESLERLCVAQ